MCGNELERQIEWSVSQGLSRASGTKLFTHKVVPGLKSWAKFTASLRDDEGEPFSHSLPPGRRGGTVEVWLVCFHAVSLRNAEGEPFHTVSLGDEEGEQSKSGRCRFTQSQLPVAQERRLKLKSPVRENCTLVSVPGRLGHRRRGGHTNVH